MFNKYPYTDFHELNLDWFLEEFVKVTDKVTDLDTTVQQFTDFVTNYFDNLDVQEEINRKLDIMVANGTMADLLQPIVDEFTADIRNEIDVLEGRVDNITQLPPGSVSTAADAELVDVRVEYDGKIASTAGDAVREQVSNIYRYTEGIEKDTYSLFFRNLIDADKYEDGTYAHENPSSISTGNNTQIVPGFRIYKDITYTFKNIYGYFCTIIYDDGTIEGLAASPSPATITVVKTPTQNGMAYVTVNNGYYTTAMCVAGLNEYTGAYIDGYSGAMKAFPTIIGPANYSTYIPDLDAVPENQTYAFVSTTAMLADNGGLWTSVPLPLTRNSCTCVLQSVGKTGTDGCSQICNIINRNEVYTRSKQLGTWTPWAPVGKGRTSRIIVDINGSGDFTSFTEAIKYATQFENSYVYVLPGTYDIISEYEAYYSASFFNDFDNTTTDTGVVLENGITVECAPGSLILCNYTGANTYVQNLFSPLNAGAKTGTGKYGFTLIGCNVEDHNVRYSMHDERNYNTDFYIHKYDGCYFKHDKGTGTGYKQALGGGLGQNGLIEIDNCIFESVTSTENIVSYHNCQNAGSKSNIFIRNSIIKGGVRFSWYGTSTEMSTMIISACQMLSAPVTTQESSAYNTVNVQIFEFCNDY